MRYEIHVKGHLHRRWSSWLYNFEVNHLSDGTTALTGALLDAAAVGALFKIINRLADAFDFDTSLSSRPEMVAKGAAALLKFGYKI